MLYKSPLIEGKFIKRYKRFFADILIDGELVTAHVPNTGSMKTCISENAPCYLTHNPDPKRKLKWTLERLVIEDSQVGVNTGIPNGLVFEAWQNKIIPHWKTFDKAQKEVKINSKSRLDLALWKSQDFPDLDKINLESLESINSQIKNSISYKDTNKALTKVNTPQIHFIEIKNVTMAIDGVALFPDAVTSRGAKHIEELVQLIELGHTCEMVFVIQRENIKSFEIAKDIDPEYDKALSAASKKGLQVTALKVEFKKNETKVEGMFNYLKI